MHGLEPPRERQLGVLKDGPCLGTGLKATLLALKNATAGDGVILLAAALPAHVAIPPTCLEQGQKAFLFGAILILELLKGQSLLELNLILDGWGYGGSTHIPKYV
jgi:hypothetical protein